MSLPVAAIFTVVGAVIIGVGVLYWFILPFSRFSYQLPLVTTLALSVILESIISLIFGVNVKSIPIESSDSIEMWGVYITRIQIVIVVSAVLMLSLLAFVVHLTGLGRKIRALRENPLVTQSLGISQRRIQLLVFLTSSILASYAGVLIGMETNLQPTMGGAFTMKAFAAMILGGLGNLWGTILAAFLLGFIENLGIGLDLGSYSLPAGYKDAFAYLFILGVLLIKPTGLFGSFGRKV